MASYTPPIESLPIFDNEVFQSTNNSTVLTVGTANLLYLRKTFTDTATALETFSAGILTNLLNPITASSTIDIATNSTGVINIGTLGGRSTVIHIGDGNSNIAGGAVHINNGTNTASNVQILNGSGSTGTITLGSTTSTLTVNSPISMGYSTLPSYGNSDIGKVYFYTYSSTTLPTSPASVGTITITTAGVYVINYAIYITSATNPTSFYTTLSGGAVNGTNYGYSTINSTNMVSSGSQVITLGTNTSTTYTITATYAGGTTLLLSTGNSYFKLVKIA